MFKDSIEWAVDNINENFQLSSDVRIYTYDLGETALVFVKNVWNVSMILASVVFAIVACYELYALSVRTEARGGPMGSAEIAFKVMFKVAVCYVMLQVSFDILINLYKTSNSLIEAIGGVSYGAKTNEPVIDWDEISGDVPSGLSGIVPFFFCLVIWFLSWAAKWAAVIMILCRLVQIYLYLAIAPIPLATFPSQEYSQIAKSFLKSFVAVALQGALIYLTVRLMPPLVSTALNSGFFAITNGNLVGELSIAAMYSAVILITIVGTQQIARRICNAM